MQLLEYLQADESWVILLILPNSVPKSLFWIISFIKGKVIMLQASISQEEQN